MDMEKVKVIDGRLSGKSDVKSSKVTFDTVLHKGVTIVRIGRFTLFIG